VNKGQTRSRRRWERIKKENILVEGTRRPQNLHQLLGGNNSTEEAVQAIVSHVSPPEEGSQFRKNKDRGGGDENLQSWVTGGGPGRFWKE